jgi:hypothetical protein
LPRLRRADRHPRIERVEALFPQQYCGVGNRTGQRLPCAVHEFPQLRIDDPQEQWPLA